MKSSMAKALTATLSAMLLFSWRPAQAELSAALYSPGGRTAMTQSHDLTLPRGDGTRALDLRVTWPAKGERCPVIVWSHGAFGSRSAYRPLADFWAQHCYVVIQPTHGDSLEYSKTLSPAFKRSWDERPADVTYILDHLADIAEQAPGLTGVMDPTRIGMGGHSFGAHTAQLLAGLAVRAPLHPRERRSFADPRPRAFVMISPQGTGRIVDEASYKPMTAPLLFVTGSKDEDPVNHKPFSWRMEAVHMAGSQQKWLLFLEGADHGFGGISGVERMARLGRADPAQVDAVAAATLAMFDAFVKESAPARDYLDNNSLYQESGGQISLVRQ